MLSGRKKKGLKNIGLNKTLIKNRFLNRATCPVPFSNASGHPLSGWVVHGGVGSECET